MAKSQRPVVMDKLSSSVMNADKTVNSMAPLEHWNISKHWDICNIGKHWNIGILLTPNL
jgi:hypothetical protein